MALLEIKDLHVAAGTQAILKGIDLTIAGGEVHSIMGPNGSGKSTLAGVLAGREEYRVTGGSVHYNGIDLLALAPEERAHAGLFLAFQYPVEIPGVSGMQFLRSALNGLRQRRGQPALNATELLRLFRERAALVELDLEMLKRPLNVDFSGGEKKRMEVYQLAVLAPTLAILDETDSGLDIDALKIVANGVNSLRDRQRAFLVITHYQRLLDHIRPDFVHVMVNGRIVRSGGADLARELERHGYGPGAGVGGTAPPGGGAP